ncbi:MAG: hypothetical protein GC179_08750 [Anaerolineaceae bacterium]|nr:hypothetical protein [Anaerolineaceae bacterium]
MTTAQIELTFKEFVGKPNEDQQGEANGGKYEPVIRSLKDVIMHNAHMGKMIAPGAFDETRFQTDKQAGIATSKTARSYGYFKSMQLVFLDVDEIVSLNQGVQADIENILDHYNLRDVVSAIYPSSNYGKNGLAKMHLLFVLDKPITEALDVRSHLLALAKHLGMDISGALADANAMKATQPLYGTVFTESSPLHGQFVSKDMVYYDASATISLDWLAKLPRAEDDTSSKVKSKKLKRRNLPREQYAETVDYDSRQEVYVLKMLQFWFDYHMNNNIPSEGLHNEFMRVVWAALSRQAQIRSLT